MKWAIYNFPTKELVPVDFLDYREACKHVNREKQTVVSLATTEEDEKYGIDMCCDHALDPEDCIYCNPAYRDAYYTTCPWCNEHNTGGDWHATWSIPWTPEVAVRHIAGMANPYNGTDGNQLQLVKYYARMAYEEPSPFGDPAMVLCLCCNEPHEWTEEWKP